MDAVPGGRTVHIRSGVRAFWSDASRGDLRPTGHGTSDGPALAALVGELARSCGDRLDGVAWASQVHGADVRPVRPSSTVTTTGSAPDLWYQGEGDALVTSSPRVAVCVLTADCAPLALASAEGHVGAVHAGWRGLRGGVVEAAVDSLRRRGATDVVASLGPCIHAECYEFGPVELESVAATYGETVRGRTASGAPALDLPAAVAAAVSRAGARMAAGVDECTSCAGGWFSHRARGDGGRQALVVWSSGPESA